MTDSTLTLGSTTTASEDAPTTAGRLWLVVVLLCLQAELFIGFATGRLDLVLYLECHLGLCAATTVLGCWWAASSSAPDPADRIVMVLQLVAWTALAGPFGTLIAAGLLVPRAAASKLPDAEPRATLSRLELLHNALLDRRLHLDQEHPIRPLMDVIIDGTQLEKFDALSLISKRYVPAAAPALKRALEDKDASVRVLAATVMAQQHNACTKRIGDCQTTARATPDSPDGWRQLGKAHLDYAMSGLLEGSRAETEFGQARSYLARAERLEPVGRLAVFSGQPTAASDLLVNHEQRGGTHGP
jgi:hypothetical protein